MTSNIKVSDTMRHYSTEYNDYLDEAAGTTDDHKKPKNKKKGDNAEDGSTSPTPSMMFDFRRGSERWPSDAVKLLSPADAQAWITEERKRLTARIAKQQAQAIADKNKSATLGQENQKTASGIDDIMDPMDGEDFDYSGFVADGKTTNPMDGYGGGANRYGSGGYYDDSSSSSEEEDNDLEDALRSAIDDIDDDDSYDDDKQTNTDKEKVIRDKRIADAESKLNSPSPSGAIFKSLSDGSTALQIPGGWRLCLDLQDLEKGGDATRGKREAEKKKQQEEKEKRELKWKKKREAAKAQGGGGYYGGGGYGGGYNISSSNYASDTTKAGTKTTGYQSFTPKLTEYTITLDLQLSPTTPIPHSGLSLIHTSLLRTEEIRGTTKIIQTNGETYINCDGGVGQLGTFGDVGKTKITPGKWHRVVISIKCGGANNDDKADKGELRTWIDSKPCCVLRSDEIKRGGRFELDLTNLYLFSSNDESMMPGNVLLRTITVEEGFATDTSVLANRAKDKIWSVWNEEFERKVDVQRAGLSLAGLFSKPRPIWSTPAFVGTFGDAFIEGTTFEGSSCLAWSYTVLNHTLQRTLTHQRRFYTGFSRDDFGVLSDMLHILSKSAVVFQEMARLIQNPGETQLMNFLRKMKKYIGKLNAGESMLFPLIVEGEELLLLFMRTRCERYYNLAVIASNPVTSLKFHAVDASRAPPRIQYRTALVLNKIDKKSATCDVFWSAVFNLTTRCVGGSDSEGDLEKFYDILLPFVTQKPLEQSLVEVEMLVADKILDDNSSNGDTDDNNSKVATISDDKPSIENVVDKDATIVQDNEGIAVPTLAPIPVPTTPHGLIGPWRNPQRSATAYVRCLFEAVHFLLTTDPDKKMSTYKAEQVILAVQAELIDMVSNDLSYVHPEDSDQRACEIAIRTFSHSAVKLSDDFTGVIEYAKDDATVKEAQQFLHIVPEAVRAKVVDTGTILEAIADQEHDLPPTLCLDQVESAAQDGKEDDNNNATTKMQFRDLLTFDTEPNIPDPGQATALKKYDSVDMLLIKECAQTREEAVDALRQCDLMCVRLGNQSHCVKNPKFLIVALIEHLFVQVVQTPKPRAMPWMDPRATKRAKEVKKRRVEMTLKEAKDKVHRATEFESFYKGGGNSNAQRQLQIAKTELKEAQEKAHEMLGVDDDGEPVLSSLAAAVASGSIEGIEKGCACEEALYQEDCYWDQPIQYELQVELLITLQRLMENFVSASMSIHATRAFDSVCMVVPGIITCIADACLRRMAIDRPSPFSGTLLGINAKDGRRLGFPGFGLGLGGFAAQVETMEVHTPELSVAATSVLDYFGSPDQKRLDTVFDWEQNFMLRPTRNLIKMLRHTCRALSFTTPTPYSLLVDECPGASQVMKQFPEIKAYRDLVLWWKYFLNPDIDVFPNSNNEDIGTYNHMQAQLKWSFDSNSSSYTVNSFSGEYSISCCPDPNKLDSVTRKPKKIATHRYPSNATPSFYCPQVTTEDDIIYCPNLPTFADKKVKSKDEDEKGGGKTKASTSGAGSVSTSNVSTNSGGLSQRDSELLLSFMTVPYLRLPLALTFFSSEDRVHKLQSSKLRSILDSIIFEPGRHLRVADTGVIPLQVPTQHKHLLSTSYGLLCNELHRTPETVLRSVQAIVKGALALDTGELCNMDEDDFNTGVQIILYVTRLTSRVDNFVSFLIDTKTGRHPCLSGVTLREVDINSQCLATLQRGLDGIRNQLHDEVAPLLENYLLKLDRGVTDKAGDEKLLDRNSRLACDIHAHQLLLLRNFHSTDLSIERVKSIIGSFVFLTTRHTWNKATRKKGKLLIPETEIYEVLQVTRRKIIAWVHNQKQGTLDEVLQTAMQVSSSSTGSFNKIKGNVIGSNRWARITGPSGRYAVSSTRKINAKSRKESVKKKGSITEDDLESLPPPREITRSNSQYSTVGVVADSTVLGVEMDLQIGQMTLRAKHLQALDSKLASHPDVKFIFGEHTMQVSVLESAQHRQRYRLVGLNHELDYWTTQHNDCPPLSESYEREYDPAELAPHEGWVAKLFEPVRTSFFDGPQPPPMQFMMPMLVPKNAEIVVLVGLHQVLRGTFKLVHIFRYLKGIQIFEVVSQGRQWYYSLHLSTMSQFSLKDLQPSYADRDAPFPKWWQEGAGNPYPRGVHGCLFNSLEGESRTESVLIKRDPSDQRNLSGGIETYVPARLLFGTLPQSLLDAYIFWQDEAVLPTSVLDVGNNGHGGDRLERTNGYQRLRGYPKKNAKGCEETLLIVEFQCIGSWDTVSFSQEGSINACGEIGAIDVIQLPGRSVRVSRIPINYARDDLTRRRKFCSYLETLQLLSPQRQNSGGSKEKKSRTHLNNKADKVQKGDSKFKVGEQVEYDADGTSKTWVPGEVLKVYPGAGKLYDIDTKGPLGRQTQVPEMFLRIPARLSEGRETGYGVWIFDGLSDSEDEAWGDVEDEENFIRKISTKDGSSEMKSKHSITFEQLDRLGHCLSLVGNNLEVCFAICRRLSSESKTITSIRDLSNAIAIEAQNDYFKEEIKESCLEAVTEAKDASENTWDLLNILTAPRRSRLHSLLKTLVRIETAGHILAWTKRSSILNITADEHSKSNPFPSSYPWWTYLSSSPSGQEFDALYGCPPINIVELPRLKLSFTVRSDYNRIQRLYSMDHNNLFVCNERNTMVNSMIQGIPHSLVLSNIEGEMHILIPVLNPYRPRVLSDPFTTSIVLDRSDSNWRNALTSRYFMYPVHVSTSFMMTKGLHAAMYLLLLRLLHRDYEEVFRLADSISSDSAFSSEGNVLFDAFENAYDDHHPDAHACRLKISLATLESDRDLPWNITLECAKYIVKYDRVTALCVIDEEAEYQLLSNSDIIVTDDSHPDYNKFDRYFYTIVKNRCAALFTMTSSSLEGQSVQTLQKAECSHPPRAKSTNWPYFMDNTVFGENCSKISEIVSIDEWDELFKGLTFPAIQNEQIAGKQNVLPFAAELALRQYEQYNNMEEGTADLQAVNDSKLSISGWAYGGRNGVNCKVDESEGTGDQQYPPSLDDYKKLQVVIFHVLWSSDAVKIMPIVEQIATSYPSVNFSSVRADHDGLDELSRKYSVSSFPTLIAFRGKKEVGRINGPDQFIGRLDIFLRNNTTARDAMVQEALVLQTKFETRYGKETATICSSEIVSQNTDDSNALFASLEEFQAELKLKDDDETEELVWVWDPDYAACNIKVRNYGTCISYISDDLEQDVDNNDKLLASAKWQIKGSNGFDNDSWETIDPAACIQCERQYRMGLLFTKGRIVAMGKEKIYEITADPEKVKINNDEISGMNAEVSNARHTLRSFRRKGPRTIVKGDEKFTDKTQKSRDRYEVEWKAAMKNKRINKSEGDSQGIRGTHGFMEETGKYTWSLKWCHEPGLQGEGDAVGICSELGEGFGPYTPPLLGTVGGVSIGLYANGALFYQNRQIARLIGPDRSLEATVNSTAGVQMEEEEDAKTDMCVTCDSDHPLTLKENKYYYCDWCGERHTHWICAFCNTDYCQKCYLKKLDALDESKTEEKNESNSEANDAGEEKSDSEDGDKDTNNSDCKEKEDSPDVSPDAEKDDKKKICIEDLFPVERVLEREDLAPLFGKNSVITITLDTDRDGGLLSFDVDGETLVAEGSNETTLDNIFQKLSTTTIYPCICMIPTDKEQPLAECNSPQKNGSSNAKNGTKNTKTTKGSFTEDDDDDDHENLVQEENKKQEQEAISELAHLCRQPYSKVATLSDNERGELRQIVVRIMKKRSPSVMLVLDDENENDAMNALSKQVEKLKEDGIDDGDPGIDNIVRIEIPKLELSEGLEVEFFQSNENNEGDWIKVEISKVITSVDQSPQNVGENSKRKSKSTDDVLYEVSYTKDDKEQMESSVPIKRLRAIMLLDSVKVGCCVELSNEDTDPKQWVPAMCMSMDGPPDSPKFNVQLVDGTMTCIGTDRLRLRRPILLAPGEATSETEPAPESSQNDDTTDNNFLSVPIDRVVWMHETQNGWVPHEKEISKQMETALRDGRIEIDLTVGDMPLQMKLVRSEKGNSGLVQIDEEENKQRLRRHICGEGLQAVWEMLSLKYTPPSSLNGASALSQLGTVWNNGDTFKGESCGLGFLFLYNLLCGNQRVSMIPNRYSFSYSYSSQQNVRNDAHRYAMLLAQLMNKNSQRSLMGSIANILIRNRHVCVRMPRFRDTRKMKQSPIFNGWVDENEPRSSIAELFSKVVPALQHMRHQRSALRFPPQPPYAEMEPNPTAINFVSQGVLKGTQISKNEKMRTVEAKKRLHASLHDTSRDVSHVSPITYEEIIDLVKCTQFKLGNSIKTLPINIDELAGFEAVAVAAMEDHKKLVISFTAEWCGACKLIKPLVRQFSMRLKSLAIFATVDLDEDDGIAQRFNVSKVPTIVLLGGGSGPEHEKGRIEGGGPGVGAELLKLFYLNSSQDDMMHVHPKSTPPDHASVRSLEVSGRELHDLALTPLAQLNHFTKFATRTDRGLLPVTDKIDALGDLHHHKSASTAVAKSMLDRLQKDVALYAHSENERKEGYIKGFSEENLDLFFVQGEKETMASIKSHLQDLLSSLNQIRNEDSRCMKEMVPFLRHISNYVGLGANQMDAPATTLENNSINNTRTLFFLKQVCGAVPKISIEFLFGATLSTNGLADISALNPYLGKEGNLELMMRLVTVSMLRSNRIGHANRCIGMTLQLLNLVDLSLGMGIDISAKSREASMTMKAKIVQASTALAGGLLSQRHFMQDTLKNEIIEDNDPTPNMTVVSTDCISYDPRFLLFEFIWNILLRKKQVEIVNSFRHHLGQGRSKIKQMIMGAGKTFVVAPLLALCLADGNSLVLSLVPKALLEMNRTIMRETFASIITKRIHTLTFDRSSVVTKSMLQSIENARKNRGVIVATPTTLKSFQLVYIETLQRIEDTTRCGEIARSKELTLQAKEMANVLRIFHNGVVLLDEVDMVLHPLKSELNFPIGEKHSLDGADQGQRWSLVIHLVDAIFFASTGRVNSFEQSGSSLGILKKLSTVINEGYNQRSLQHLPHVTLLNPEFYHKKMKPILADWCYLWLQKQHLHGIEKKEVIDYILEGAVARGDLQLKLRMIDTSLSEVRAKKGLEYPEPNLTLGHSKVLSPEHLRQREASVEMLKREVSGELEKEENHDKAKLLSLKLDSLVAAKYAVTEEARLMNEIFNAEEIHEEHLKNVAEQTLKLGQEILSLQKEIELLENPRDSSQDNDTVLWCSPFAFQFSAADESDEEGNYEEGEIEGATKSLGPDSVEGIISTIEEAGLTCKRCSNPDEAISLARDLLARRRLRCVIFGGHDDDGKCLHDKPVRSSKDSSEVDIVDFFSQLRNGTDGNEMKVPVECSCLYAGSSRIKEEIRIALWKNVTTVSENSTSLVSWISSIPNWGEEEEEDDDNVDEEIGSLNFKKTEMTRQKSIGSTRLEECCNELETCLMKKKTLESANEDQIQDLRNCTIAKHQELVKFIQRRLEIIESYIGKTVVLESALKNTISNLVDDPCMSEVVSGHNASSGRDSAHGIAWINWALSCDMKYTTIENKAEYYHALCTARSGLLAEKEGLHQVLLAAKIMTFVSSPTHKKLMNLSHDWLRTFLPHCLSKVNRVSFGLLTSEECLTALNEDFLVPRSRLGLAVPFMGKDVPSKSAEFAHPDITIGLTIMAYRYSGMRDGDFSDLIDSISSDFAHEIGPARERPSSLLYESWINAAGGTIRGISPQDKVEPLLEKSKGIEIDDNNEVVQLKFLQQTNIEQMSKLQKMWNREPTVLHHYLSNFIFPEHMRTQRSKLSASGQSVGGDMLVGRRVGFSGTPSDLLPKELGECDYETGDDGKMLSTVLDPSIMSTAMLLDGWTVDALLRGIATKVPPYQALIDTGALITGFSNVEVAEKLLEYGLPWCEGVVFLDNEDKKQVLVRATGRVVSQEQCGVPLEKRFAFYDQIHTTGTDIKHVVNATAVITLGKDMVFRDYVQGAYRMRQIGKGQGIDVFIIPEVAELMMRETKKSDKSRNEVEVFTTEQKNEDRCKVLWKIVAWLIINSMRSEQVQWAMLCIQNISNIYQKNAFDVLRVVGKRLTLDGQQDGAIGNSMQGKLLFESPLDPTSQKPLDHLRPSESMSVFVEPIDFTLDSTVPDPQPFESKLRSLLDENNDFITSEAGHNVGLDILKEVGKYSNEDASANKLATTQEREQEQEQQKEVKARRDQQVEIEKFVEREYSRNEEEQKPWPISFLMQTPPSRSNGDIHIESEETEEERNFPFYKLDKFKLFSHHGSLAMPPQLMCSKNYFNDKWSGLRRVKNTIMVMEWSPKSASGELLSPEAYILKNVELTQERKDAIRKSFLLLGGNKEGGMGPAGIRDTIQEVTDLPAATGQIHDMISAAFPQEQRDSIDLKGFTSLLRAGHLLPSHNDRYYVALSLLEAETILRVLHIRGSQSLINTDSINSPEVAIRFSPLATPGLSMGDGGVAFGASSGWQAAGDIIAQTGATATEAAISHSTFRFFDCDMHYSEAQVNVLIRSLQTSSTLDRERFFMSTIGVRRRMDRKWQDTPLAKVFLLEDEYAALKRRAQTCFIRNKLKQLSLKKWEAFVAFDSNDNGHLSPDEIYGALRYLEMPDLTPSDVADFLEAGDSNRDGLLDYKEYLDMLGGEDEDEEVTDKEKQMGESDTSIVKVGAYGLDVMRQVLTERRRAYQEKMHTEQIRRNLQQAELENKIFEEELSASAARVGGANPKRFFPDTSDEDNNKQSINCNYYGVNFTFTSNKAPIRTVVTGRKPEFCGVLHDKMRRKALTGTIPIACPGCNKNLLKMEWSDYYQKCASCQKYGYDSGASSVEYRCVDTWKDYNSECYQYYMCGLCYSAKKSEYLEELARVAQKDTYAQCPVATTLSLLIPSGVITGSAELGEKLSNMVNGLVESAENNILQSNNVSKILADRFLCERISHSTKAQQNFPPGTSRQVSILSSYQTKCRLLLSQTNTLENRVKEDLSTLIESGVPDKLNTDLPILHPVLSSKSTLFSGTHLDVCFTVFMEFRLPNLPVADQRTALLRLEPVPVKMGRDSKRLEASIYIQKGGVLAGSQTVKVTAGGEEHVKSGRWHVLIAMVDCISGVLNLYLDGKFVRTVTYSSKMNEPKLGLGSRLIVFGGGKQSESRGGELRLVRLIDGALTKDELDKSVIEIQSINPLYHASATTIQALGRCINARTRCITLRSSLAKELGLDPDKAQPELNIKRKIKLEESNGESSDESSEDSSGDY